MKIDCTIYIDDGLIEKALDQDISEDKLDEIFDLIGVQVKYKWRMSDNN